MIDYGTVRSTVKPESKVIDDFAVWLNLDIAQDGGEYTYRQLRYGKDEYIIALEQQMTDMQLALCDLFEGMV